MSKEQLQPRNAVEALVVEQALLLVRELQHTCTEAADGQVLGRAEDVILLRGREFLRVALEASLQQQAEVVEKKGRRAGRAAVNDGAAARADGSARS